MRDLLRRVAGTPQGALGLAIVALIAVAVLAGPLLAPHAPDQMSVLMRYKGPSAAFPMGTDQYGRDILSRVLYGARATVLLALMATLLGAVLGAVVGTASAFLGGRADEAIMRTVDAVMSIPSLLFALLIVNLLGKSSLNAVLAIGIAFAPGMARITRSVALGVRKQDYVNAAVARGESARFIILREMLPNVIAPIVVETTIRVAFAVMLFATLSFLGLGAQPPASEWGLMVADARRFMHLNPWMIVWPSVAVALVAVGFNLLGDGLRDAPQPADMIALSDPVLSVAGYGLSYRVGTGFAPALAEIELTVGRGEVVGLVGESGSGKSSLALAIMRHLPAGVRETGRIALGSQDLTAASEREMGAVRGRRIGMVFQDPSTSLNPTLTLGEQISEVITRHRGMTRAEARLESEAMLARVGLKDPLGMMRRYPHEASGGEKQRVVIAAAFACRPECILFDEPTTALDVLTARQILDLFATLQAETGVASLYISHDLSLVALVADRVAVLHRGRTVEQGDVESVFMAPRHDYTRRLLAAVPRPDRRLLDGPGPNASSEPLLRLHGVGVTYGRPSVVDTLLRRRSARVSGARDVTLDVRPGEILGIVGESGSGKSTLARALTGLNPFTGAVSFDGRPVRGLKDMDRAYRRDVQIIFQHPDSSLNPRQTIGEILSRPLALYGGERGTARIGTLLDEVRLPANYASRRPHQLSGGEKQRVAIARAFASRPKLVICDEITSALDVSVQASVMSLLLDLQRRFGTAYLFITHDLNLVRQIAHRVAVMYRGDLVEVTEVADFASHSHHPYTRALVEAVPVPTGPVPAAP